MALTAICVDIDRMQTQDKFILKVDPTDRLGTELAKMWLKGIPEMVIVRKPLLITASRMK